MHHHTQRLIFLLVALFCIWSLVESKKSEKGGAVKPEDKMDGIIELDDKSFAETINGKQNVLVEFYAPWCTYCKRFAPKLKQFASLLKSSPRGKDLILAKVDGDEHPDLADKYSVQGYPTVLLFKKDMPIDQPVEYVLETADVIKVLDFLHQELDAPSTK